MEKHSNYFELRDACKVSGCPACTLITKTVRRYLDSLLYESVNDPVVRRKLRSSLGFCRRHSLALLTVGDAFGVAIIYQDILMQVDAALKEGAAPEIRGECPACSAEREGSESYLNVMMAFLGDEELKTALLRSDGLCLDHISHCVDKAGKEGLPLWFVSLHSDRLRRHRHDLSESLRKQDVQFKHETLTKAEERACENAIDFLVGMTV